MTGVGKPLGWGLGEVSIRVLSAHRLDSGAICSVPLLRRALIGLINAFVMVER